MTWVVLNFHRSEPAPAPGDLHTIADREFDRHLDTIESAGLGVVDPTARFQLPGSRPTRSVALTFDDASASDLANARKLAARGWRAMFFVPTALVATPGYLDWAQIDELRAMGMAIGSHGHRHLPLTDLGLDEVRQELHRSKKTLEDRWGQPIEHLAWPGGCFDRERQSIALELGFKALWTTRWGDDTAVGSPSPHAAIRRNNVVQAQSAESLLAVLHGRGQWQRRALHASMDLAKRSLGRRGYERLRALALRARDMAAG